MTRSLKILTEDSCFICFERQKASSTKSCIQVSSSRLTNDKELSKVRQSETDKFYSLLLFISHSNKLFDFLSVEQIAHHQELFWRKNSQIYLLCIVQKIQYAPTLCLPIQFFLLIPVQNDVSNHQIYGYHQHAGDHHWKSDSEKQKQFLAGFGDFLNFFSLLHEFKKRKPIPVLFGNSSTDNIRGGCE